MPLSNIFSRFENGSNESFHCCGKPEDLIEEYLKFEHNKTQRRAQVKKYNHFQGCMMVSTKFAVIKKKATVFRAYKGFNVVQKKEKMPEYHVVPLSEAEDEDYGLVHNGDHTVSKKVSPMSFHTNLSTSSLMRKKEPKNNFSRRRNKSQAQLYIADVPVPKSYRIHEPIETSIKAPNKLRSSRSMPILNEFFGTEENGLCYSNLGYSGLVVPRSGGKKIEAGVLNNSQASFSPLKPSASRNITLNESKKDQKEFSKRVHFSGFEAALASEDSFDNQNNNNENKFNNKNFKLIQNIFLPLNRNNQSFISRIISKGKKQS
ncbi:expressed protein [Phakopsora pachyrhizi]|uniref:Expressed protein n=1 Tax=Phakopsora pachyrhizi TaxID=170000 RepID=A0AAV0AJ52_PHAPC|nr:expressed protein [Phakopsora pachyrhizi]